MKTLLSLTCSFALLSSTLALPAFASSLPAGDMKTGFSIGTAPSIAIDTSFMGKTNLGASFGLPYFVNGFGNNGGRYDVRLTHNFWSDGRFFVSGIGGIWGDIDFGDVGNSGWLGLELGVALAYKFTPQITGRLNIVPGYKFIGNNNGRSAFGGFYAPSAGAELAYAFDQGLELSLGYNGQGDFLAVRFRI